MPVVSEDEEQFELSCTAAWAEIGTISLENGFVVSNKSDSNHLFNSTPR